MTTLRTRWGAAPSGVRAAVVVGAAFLVALTSIAFIDRATSGRQLSSNETQGSARSTAINGTKAYRLLLEHYRYPTRPIDTARVASLDRLTTTETLMELHTGFPSDRQRFAVLDHARRGGRVVVGGVAAASWLRSDRPGPTSGSGTQSNVRLDGRRYSARTDGRARWRTAHGPQLVVTRRVGRGEVILLADTSFLENALIGRDDNAALGIALAGTKTSVVFAEASLRPDTTTGWDAVPGGWKIAIVGGALSLLVAAIARGRRIGSAEPQQRLLDPPRRATAEVVAAGLERSGQPGRALDTLGAIARRRVIQIADLEPDASGPTVVAAAIAAGWDPEEAAALTTPPSDPDSVIALGRAFARSQKGSP